MKTFLYTVLSITLMFLAIPLLGDDAPPAPNNTQQSDEGVDVNVLGGIRVRVGKPGNGSSGVKVDVPGVRVRVGSGENTGRPATVKQSYLGFFADPLPEALAAQLRELLGESNGVLVVEILEGSPAQKASFKPHDVLVAYDGTPIKSVEHLRELIRTDHPGRTAKIDVVRASKKFFIAVEVGERIVAAPPAPEEERTPVSVRVFGRQVIVGRHGVNAPGAVIRWGTPAEVDASQGQPSTCSVTIDRHDATTLKAVVTYTGPDGKESEKRLEGTPEEIRSRLDEFPPTVGDQVRRSLDRAEAEKPTSQNVRVNVQPRVQGLNRGLHVSIQRPGQAGGSRIFDFDHVFGGEKRVEVDDLLQVRVFAGELQQLPPAVREQVEETLRDVELPEVRVEVRDSL